MTKDQFDKAKEYIKAGGDMKAIEAKYNMSQQIKKALKDAAPVTTDTL